MIARGGTLKCQRHVFVDVFQAFDGVEDIAVGSQGQLLLLL